MEPDTHERITALDSKTDILLAEVKALRELLEKRERKYLDILKQTALYMLGLLGMK